MRGASDFLARAARPGAEQQQHQQAARADTPIIPHTHTAYSYTPYTLVAPPTATRLFEAHTEG